MFEKLLDEIVKIYFDYPDLTIRECIEKGKENIRNGIKTR